MRISLENPIRLNWKPHTMFYPTHMHTMTMLPTKPMWMNNNNNGETSKFWMHHSLNNCAVRRGYNQQTAKCRRDIHTPLQPLTHSLIHQTIFYPHCCCSSNDIHSHTYTRQPRADCAREGAFGWVCWNIEHTHTHWHSAISLLAVAKDHNQFVWFSTPVNVAQVQPFLCQFVTRKILCLHFVGQTKFTCQFVLFKIKIHQIVSFI